MNGQRAHSSRSPLVRRVRRHQAMGVIYRAEMPVVPIVRSAGGTRTAPGRPAEPAVLARPLSPDSSLPLGHTLDGDSDWIPQPEPSAVRPPDILRQTVPFESRLPESAANTEKRSHPAPSSADQPAEAKSPDASARVPDAPASLSTSVADTTSEEISDSAIGDSEWKRLQTIMRGHQAKLAQDRERQGEPAESREAPPASPIQRTEHTKKTRPLSPARPESSSRNVPDKPAPTVETLQREPAEQGEVAQPEPQEELTPALAPVQVAAEHEAADEGVDEAHRALDSQPAEQTAGTPTIERVADQLAPLPIEPTVQEAEEPEQPGLGRKLLDSVKSLLGVSEPPEEAPPLVQRAAEPSAVDEPPVSKTAVQLKGTGTDAALSAPASIETSVAPNVPGQEKEPRTAAARPVTVGKPLDMAAPTLDEPAKPKGQSQEGTAAAPTDDLQLSRPTPSAQSEAPHSRQPVDQRAADQPSADLPSAHLPPAPSLSDVGSPSRAAGLNEPQKEAPGLAGQPDLETTQKLPLEAVWPVTRKGPEETRSPSPPSPAPTSGPVPLQRSLARSKPATVELQTLLTDVASGRPTDSPIELIPPRRTRPSHPPIVQRHGQETSRQAVLEPEEPSVDPVMEPVDEAMQTDSANLIQTEIGPLPEDLWGLLGQKPPTRGAADQAVKTPDESPAVQRAVDGKKAVPPLPGKAAKPVDTQADTKPSVRAGLPPALQREAVTEAESGEVGSASARTAPPDAAAEDADAEMTAAQIDRLARQVYQQVKRRLAVEWERGRGKF